MQGMYKLFIGAAILAIIVFWSAIALANAPTKAAEEFVNLLGEGRITEAYDVASVDLRNEHSLTVLEEYVGYFPELQRFDQVIFTGRQVTGKEAIVTGTVYSTSGEEYPVAVFLVRDLSGFNIFTYGGWSVYQMDYH